MDTTAKKKPRTGKGSRDRKQAEREAEYAAKHAKDVHVPFNLEGSKPRILKASKDQDCDFAKKFAKGVQNEIRLIRDHQKRYNQEVDMKVQSRF